MCCGCHGVCHYSYKNMATLVRMCAMWLSRNWSLDVGMLDCISEHFFSWQFRFLFVFVNSLISFLFYLFLIFSIILFRYAILFIPFSLFFNMDSNTKHWYRLEESNSLRPSQLTRNRQTDLCCYINRYSLPPYMHRNKGRGERPVNRYYFTLSQWEIISGPIFVAPFTTFCSIAHH